MLHTEREESETSAETKAFEHLVEDDDDEKDGEVGGGSEGDTDDDRVEDNAEFEDHNTENLGGLCGDSDGGRLGVSIRDNLGLSSGSSTRGSSGVFDVFCKDLDGSSLMVVTVVVIMAVVMVVVSAMLDSVVVSACVWVVCKLVGELATNTVSDQLDDKDGEHRDHGESECEGVILEVGVETW